MTDVDSAKIPIFVDEEVYDVNGVKDCADENWFGDEAMKLELVCNKGKVAGPELAKYSSKNRASTSILWKHVTWSHRIDHLHQCPSNDSRSPVGEKLEIEISPKSRVEFDTHVKVVQYWS
jgi:hypothetical protein